MKNFLLIAVIALTGCTSTCHLKHGMKLVGMEWRTEATGNPWFGSDPQLWLLCRPMRANETAETYTATTPGLLWCYTIVETDK